MRSLFCIPVQAIPNFCNKLCSSSNVVFLIRVLILTVVRRLMIVVANVDSSNGTARAAWIAAVGARINDHSHAALSATTL